MAEHVSAQVTGRCGSVLVRLIPAPRGTGIVSAPVPKKLLMMAGIDDCYTSARGCTATLGNFGKGLSFEYQCFRIKRCMLEYFNDNNVYFLIAAKATFDAISKTYSYLTPDLWKETVFTKSPYQVMCIINRIVPFHKCIMVFLKLKCLSRFRNSLIIWPRLTPGSLFRGPRELLRQPPKFCTMD